MISRVLLFASSSSEDSFHPKECWLQTMYASVTGSRRHFLFRTEGTVAEHRVQEPGLPSQPNVTFRSSQLMTSGRLIFKTNKKLQEFGD